MSRLSQDRSTARCYHVKLRPPKSHGDSDRSPAPALSEIDVSAVGGLYLHSAEEKVDVGLREFFQLDGTLRTVPLVKPVNHTERDKRCKVG